MLRIAPGRLALTALIAATSGCANVDYADTKPGKIDGQVVVVWLKGTQGSGDGTFVYVPTRAQPMTFTRADASAKVQVFEPPIMYTDGGSIPAIGRVFNGLTPWNYGPAYIIHDWIFEARQCRTDQPDDPAYAFIDDVTFQHSAEIIAESIKALEVSGRVPAKDISGATVTAAVTSPFSRARWTAQGACNEVSETDRKLALSAVNLDPRVGDRSRLRSVRDRNGKVVPVGPAEVVAIYTFGGDD